MQPETVLQALISVWAELPERLGPHWQELYHELESKFESLQTAREPKERAALAAELVKLCGKYPSIKQHLHEAIQRVADLRNDSQRKGNGQPPSNEPAWTELVTGLTWAASTPTVTRYADITAPQRIKVGQRGVITVGLTSQPVPDSVEPRPLKVEIEQFIEVSLQYSKQRFEIIGEPAKRIRVESNKDTEPAVLQFRGIKPGANTMVINFRQSGITVGTVRLHIEVIKEKAFTDDVQVVKSEVQVGNSYYPPPDLEIRVLTERIGSRLEINYELHSLNGTAGFHHHRINGPTIDSADEYKVRLIEKIENLSKKLDASGQALTQEESDEKLVSLGQGLYQKLFDDKMRMAYRQFREKVKTILITSDEPWIPWEMIKPYDDGDKNNRVNDDFLCIRFQMTRWLAGQSGPPGKIHVSKLACIEAATPPGGQPLKYATAEHEFLTSTFQSVKDVSPKCATSQEVRKLLDEGGIGLWHFAAHGNYIDRNPDESLILLADGKRLRAEDITGQRQTNIARDRPLMFLNACRVGQQGWSLTGLAGWATTLVENCLCGAFVGPLWGINDHLAFEFAKCFYAALSREKTVGQASLEARKHVMSIDPSKLTWLAYNIYAHPNAKIYLNQSPPTQGPEKP